MNKLLCSTKQENERPKKKLCELEATEFETEFYSTIANPTKCDISHAMRKKTYEVESMSLLKCENCVKNL